MERHLCFRGDERLYFVHAPISGVLFVVEKNVAFDPVFAGLFGAKGVMFDADGIADLVEQFSGGFFHVDLFLRRVYNSLILF